jgi:hypothetical protein
VPRIADRSRAVRGGPIPLLLVAALAGMAAAPFGPARVRGESAPDHLVISEVVTGGAGASDEFVEIYNPTAGPLPLEGLELVYVTASGLTVSRRAAWDAGAPEVQSRHHLLVANEVGAYAGIADAHYASGLAATGGSLALRIQGAATAIDAVGWGNAASTWLEGVPAPAPAAGSSIERLPGGALGSTRDTDDNASDFVVRLLPDPQNSTSAPTPDGTVAPTPTPLPSGSSPTASPSPSPSSTPAPTPDPAVSIATARALPDGTRVTIEGTALTSSTFTEGGGYVADDTAGIAILVSAGSFERGQRLRISGTVDDRFAQRTVRASGMDVAVSGPGSEPDPLLRSTGSLGEGVEGQLVRTSGRIAGSPTSLSAGLAYEIDDGSGAIRVVVGSDSGIVTSEWASGSRVELIGVVGQRDSSGTGSSGYRLQPRDPADVLAVGGETPSPAPSGSPPPAGSPSLSPSPAPGGVMTIAEARALPKHATARVRGTVTLEPGLVDPVSAVMQDGTGAILLRMGGETGTLARGDRVEISGVRSTLAGMETLRVTGRALKLGTGPDPAPVQVRTGDAGEALEAHLVRVRGALVASARRVSSGTVSFELDDGSGPLRVYLAAPLGADTTGLVSGTWVEATGVLGQETTGAQPLRGYRVWPRTAAEVVVGASPTEPAGLAAGSTTGVPGGSAGGGAGGADGASLAEIADMPADLAALHVGATLVHGPWPELDVAGLLWDGERIVAIAMDSERGVRSLLGDARPPVLVQLTGLAARGAEPRTGLPLVTLGMAPGDAALREGPPHPPAAEPEGPAARWVSVVGRLAGAGDGLHLLLPAGVIAVSVLCDDPPALPSGTVQAVGVGLGEPWRLLVPCGGVRPAPVLDHSLPDALAAASVARVDRVPRGQPRASSPDAGHTRGLAAALLGIGSLAVVGAAVLARRLGPDDGPPDESRGATLPDEGAAQPTAPRALTLVSMPRERGSP